MLLIMLLICKNDLCYPRKSQDISPVNPNSRGLRNGIDFQIGCCFEWHSLYCHSDEDNTTEILKLDPRDCALNISPSSDIKCRGWHSCCNVDSCYRGSKRTQRNTELL